MCFRDRRFSRSYFFYKWGMILKYEKDDVKSKTKLQFYS